MTQYPKRLIEVDLPIKRISAHARREKSIRHGHISTLHIWWARRPLAACRAVICASLWPDPADDLCPQSFRDAVARILPAFAEQVRSNRKLANLCPETWSRWKRLNGSSWQADHPGSWADMRYALLDFIADFANWDASTAPAFLETSRALTQAAHEALGGAPGTRPLVVDPFAGGGAIPLEALRVGADAFASDLNPVAVLLNKVILEYIPKYGNAELHMKDADGQEVVFHGLAEAVRYWGNWIKEQAEAELAEFYPKDPDGATPIAYLWARTIISEAPDDGTGIPVEVPLMRSMWLAKKRKGRSKALRWVRDSQGEVQTEILEMTYADGVTRTVRRPLLEIFEPLKDIDVEKGTVNRGVVTCPITGYTTPATSVRRQLKTRGGGANDARLLAVVITRENESGRFYRLPKHWDSQAVVRAEARLQQRKYAHNGILSLVPNEPTPMGGGSGAGRAFSQRNYGMDTFESLFTPRQALVLTTLTKLVQKAAILRTDENNNEAEAAVQSCLSMMVSKQADYLSSLCTWHYHNREKVNHTFARQALPFVSDFVETVSWGTGAGSWNGLLGWMIRALEKSTVIDHVGHGEQLSATKHALPDDLAQAFITDPPYYDAVPYSDLSDFFFVWLKRMLPFGDFANKKLTPKDEECIVDEQKGKDKEYFESMMRQAMAEGRRVLAPQGVGVIVFAHKSTTGWEAQLDAMIKAGWTITGSWPIDTEMGTRLRARESAALASSIHLVCRPRENVDGSLRTEDTGDWRTVLHELPGRIHAWLPRLANEGVVGADAIFACLGPALEIYSRYSRVEKASGEVVTLSEYLEHVWGAVSREALNMVFAGADTTGFEEDARLSAMWLWTLNAGEAETDSGQGFTLEYDAARKIAQGLGIYLEQLTHLVEVKGSKARLLPVAERTQYLFGQESVREIRRPKRASQASLFESLDDAESYGWQPADDVVQRVGETTLDRVHQSMLLFSAGRSEALRRFVVDEGVGKDERFWRLAQALSALYPAKSNEKRWVDGLLARKKGLGF